MFHEPRQVFIFTMTLIHDIYLLFFSLVLNANTTKILITYHTTQQTVSERLKQGLLDQNLACYLLNESTPHSSSARANAVQWCDIFVIVISRSYQRTHFCMEALNYAKDLRKPMIAILAESTFQPYGALGVISASAIQSIVLSDDNSFGHAVSTIANSARTQKTAKANTVNVVDPSEVKMIYQYCYLKTLTYFI
jgi:hypothetical protein